ncbi:ThiF family adenylyltransferase [Mesobacillus zeae]|uniref:Thiazole biosynthesis adenylyltransferase ThiF n=1 Tax=Mesobacillus zeae TaxID=1917180 RepID=A0A398BFE3_9BACI|nr:ThiF family adenylyltransferase [Mesobacillus zeae]RID86283.1 thiazole biosynthesis adenylyltransferase ThiF [Mesobacillus zeae]
MEMERYSRQLLFGPIGEEGQKKLLGSRAAVAGMGALGTVIANHLVRSGVGYVRLIDRDIVELSNLQRQLLYDEDDAAANIPKAVAAANKLRRINSTVKIEPVIADLNPENAEELLGDVDVIMDGTDNFSTRYLINDLSAKLGIPWIYGGAVSSRGMYTVIIPGSTPCFRCLFPDVPAGMGETCDTVGVLSPVTDIIGSFQAAEALKLLLGAKSNPNLEQLDIWNHTILQMDVSQGRSPECPACGRGQYEFLEKAHGREPAYTVLCGRETIQINPGIRGEVNLTSLASRLQHSGQVLQNSFLLKFSPEAGVSMVFFKDGRVLVHGVDHAAQAKAYYAKYYGS